MPPKRLRATTTKIKETISPSVSVSIQTEAEDNNEEVLNYKNQISILEKELQLCRTLIITLQNENTILKNQSNNIQDNLKSNLVDKSTLKIKNEKISSPRLETKIVKGCNCKGNCSNKICGCVKKGIICREFCKCTVQCRNQEPEKENFKQNTLSKDGQNALEKLGRLTLNQEVLHASEKKSKRGLFSPFPNTSISNTTKNHPVSPLILESRRRLFTQDSDDLVDIDSNTNREDAVALEPEHTTANEKISNLKKSQTPLPYSPAPKLTKRLKNTQVNNTNFLRNSSITVTDSNESDSNNLVVEKCVKIIHSPKVVQRKSKSASPDAHVNRRKHENEISTKPVPKYLPSKSHSNGEFDNKKIKQYLGKVKYSPQSCSNKTESVLNQNNVKSKLDVGSMNIYLSPQQYTDETSTELSPSPSKSNSNNDNQNLDISVNPMVPKKQLPRSPVNITGATVVSADKRFSPIKKELAVAEVDWNQHQMELIKCDKCNRKFFPHRIEKHIISCKGI